MGDKTLNETSEYNRLLLEYIELHELNKCVHFISHQKNMTDFYSAIDVMSWLQRLKHLNSYS